MESLAAAREMVTPELRLRTAVWYGDDFHSLLLPSHWNVSVFHPSPPAPLTDAQIENSLDAPCGQPPLREMLRVKPPKQPLIIVDDPNRPTPVSRVIPFLLKQFENAGVSSSNTKILVASGTHGHSNAESLARKLGPAARTCQVLLHDPLKNLVRIGKTSLGTPVSVNRHVTESDFIVGVGGIYPNHTAGFGGGSKLALGVLSLRTIMGLHCRHKRLRWGNVPGDDNLRKDLDEIARMVGFRSLISLHVDSDLNIVRLAAGDHFRYYAAEVAFAREAFKAPPSDGADVVISNAFPNDLSLTFVHKKGIYPLSLCAPGASRIVIAACSEGHGFHRLFPYVNYPPLYRARHLARRASLMTPSELAGRLVHSITRKIGRSPVGPESPRTKPRPPLHRMWLYRTSSRQGDLPVRLPDLTVTSSWETVANAVEVEQQGKKPLKVCVYPCAPLQWIASPGK